MSALVVLDTNVIVSAAIRAGSSPGEIVRRVLAQDVIVATCPSIVGEYRAVVARPKFARLGLPPVWLDAVLLFAHHRLTDPPPWPQRGPDPADLVFLSLAKLVGATLVTGNLVHFPRAIRDGVEVVDPSGYLATHPTAG